MELEQTRTVALRIAQARAIFGLVLVILPGLAARGWLKGSTPERRAVVRMLGVRDLALGVGAITNLKEQKQDAEWVGMGAVADGVDAVALAVGGEPPVRRIVGVAIAATSAVAGLLCARRIADARPAVD